MKYLLALGAGLASLAVSFGGADAADLATNAVPPADYVAAAPSMFDWGGIYFGAVGGYGWASSGIEVLGPDEETGTESYDGAVGGGFAGYNWQANAFVGGFEGDIMASGMNWKEKGASIENSWNGTFRARAGVAFGAFMPYVTAGVGFGGINLKIAGGSDSQTAVGWVVGGGAELALSRNLSIRGEYRYTDYGTDTYKVDGANINIGFDSSEVLTGIALRF